MNPVIEGPWYGKDNFGTGSLKPESYNIKTLAPGFYNINSLDKIVSGLGENFLVVKQG